jgi:hypothetical protein
LARMKIVEPRLALRVFSRTRLHHGTPSSIDPGGSTRCEISLGSVLKNLQVRLHPGQQSGIGHGPTFRVNRCLTSHTASRCLSSSCPPRIEESAELRRGFSMAEPTGRKK